MSDLKAGDIVRLKSGGPDMTVEYVDTELSRCRCSWFDGKKLSHEFFQPEALEKVEKPD